MEIAKTPKGPSGTAGHACAETRLSTRKHAESRHRRQVILAILFIAVVSIGVYTAYAIQGP